MMGKKISAPGVPVGILSCCVFWGGVLWILSSVQQSPNPLFILEGKEGSLIREFLWNGKISRGLSLLREFSHVRNHRHFMLSLVL